MHCSLEATDEGLRPPLGGGLLTLLINTFSCLSSRIAAIFGFVQLNLFGSGAASRWVQDGFGKDSEQIQDVLQTGSRRLRDGDSKVVTTARKPHQERGLRGGHSQLQETFSTNSGQTNCEKDIKRFTHVFCF